jgi:uncharacterized protein YaaR (DUF327 family)
MPKNYDKMIVDATVRISNYYRQKVLNIAGEYSVDTFDDIMKKLRDMYFGAQKSEYYLDYKWMELNGYMDEVDAGTWRRVVEPFFGAARQYIEHKQGKYGVYDSDEQAVDVAIAKLYAKIGKQAQPLRANPKQKPIDYKKTVADTVDKIVKYYKAKLKKVENQMGDRKYAGTVAEIDNLSQGADIENVEFFENFGWTKSFDGDMVELDLNMWQEYVSKFFNIVRSYVDAKNRGSLAREEEKKVMRIVKLINLKIGGGLFGGVKDIFLPDNYFMARSKVVEK